MPNDEGGIYVPTRTFLVATVTLLMAVALALFTLTEHKDKDHAGRD